MPCSSQYPTAQPAPPAPSTKMAALARDLGARFGDDMVFLDKDDLGAGAAWREAVGRTLGARPPALGE